MAFDAAIKSVILRAKRSLLAVAMTALACCGQAAPASAQDLSELSLTRTSWKRLGEQIEVRGTVVNRSELDWNDVVVNLRGYSLENLPVVDLKFRVPLVPGRGSREFAFKAVVSSTPAQCELGLIQGVREEAPDKQLSELTLSRASWLTKDGAVQVKGTLFNTSELDWTGVVLRFKGFDKSGRLVVDQKGTITSVPGNGAKDFAFRVPTQGIPVRGELGVIRGEKSQPDSPGLPGLTVTDTQWRERNGQILVTGRIINESVLDWSDVTVNFRGFDAFGYSVANSTHVVASVKVGENGDFAFWVPRSKRPARCEIGLISGSSARILQPEDIPQISWEDFPGLAVTNTTWQKSRAGLEVKGTVVNNQDQAWNDLTLNFRGFDDTGAPIVNAFYTLRNLSGNKADEFSFVTSGAKTPVRCEIGLIAGTPLEPELEASLQSPSPSPLSGTAVIDQEPPALPVVVPKRGVPAGDSATKTQSPPSASPAVVKPSSASSAPIPEPRAVAVAAPARPAVAPTPARPAVAPTPARPAVAPTPARPVAAPTPARPVAAPTPARPAVAPTPARPAVVAPPAPTRVAISPDAVKPAPLKPHVPLSGLFLLDTSWQERDGRIYVRGSVLNASEFGWSNVLVNVRGVDQQGRTVVDGQYRIASVPGHAVCNFYFQVVSSGKPGRCEFGFLSGVR